MSIRVDPGTGLKIFNTRAAKANDKIAGKGYSIITDEALITLPPKPPEPGVQVRRGRGCTSRKREPRSGGGQPLSGEPAMPARCPARPEMEPLGMDQVATQVATPADAGRFR